MFRHQPQNSHNADNMSKQPVTSKYNQRVKFAHCNQKINKKTTTISQNNNNMVKFYLTFISLPAIPSFVCQQCFRYVNVTVFSFIPNKNQQKKKRSCICTTCHKKDLARSLLKENFADVLGATRLQRFYCKDCYCYCVAVNHIYMEDYFEPSLFLNKK